MSGFISLIGWTFLPDLVTNWVQAIYYGVVIRAGDPKPQPGTRRYAEHRRRIHILVVSAYLLYTIYDAHLEIRQAGSFYSDLGLTPAATEREVKSRFRRLAALYHPDKVGSGASSPQDDANIFFMRLKVASETLTDPARRFAYDRFGPEVVAWSRCVTMRDYVSHGLSALLPYYGAAAFFMYLLGYLGYLNYGHAWRWITFFAVVVFEVHVVTRPHHPVLFDRVVNPLMAWFEGFGGSAAATATAAGAAGGRRAAAAAAASAPFAYLPFQAVQLARKLSLTVYVAMSQIGPMLGADTSSGRLVVADDDEADAAKQRAQLEQALDRLEKTGAGLDQDAGSLFNMELAPFASDKEAVDAIAAKVKEWLVQNTIVSDVMVRDALGKVLRRKRAEAPFRAKGNR
ncbi:hypothetical protein GGTG_07070 [Gaeumannomyces tritici R3-111a-1]|uniref:J domain-containing protein n=1 Tax=Gaeumannomyces tritici (strain R3-111a-1) TaxID=644352 RepID=J3P0M5_GAET3|nr:hypothetical protein GGTG_07070 [Gaeumannomyces tritici R3-111a-1]EJT77158.1 hypothetical protein GGTG_07070 [Gaeumannomyces tritici R3-111a-1]